MIGGMGLAGMPLGSTEVDDVLVIYQAQSGTVTTGDRELIPATNLSG